MGALFFAIGGKVGVVDLVIGYREVVDAVLFSGRSNGGCVGKKLYPWACRTHVTMGGTSVFSTYRRPEGATSNSLSIGILSCSRLLRVHGVAGRSGDYE